MGRAWEYNPNAIDPPEEEFFATCPNCGSPLNWNDEVFLLDADDSVIGCQYCMKSREAGYAFEEE